MNGNSEVQALMREQDGPLPALLAELTQALAGAAPGRVYSDAHSRSAQMDAFLKSFITVQKRIGKAAKLAYNSHLGNKYVTLEAVWDVIHEAIGDEPLAVFQNAVTNVEAGIVSVETTLMHESGQWMSNTMTAKPQHIGPQGVGAAVTYLRRYGLSTMFGIVADSDTDGEVRPGNRQGQNRQEGGRDARSGSQGAQQPKNAATGQETGKKGASGEVNQAISNTGGGGESKKPPFKCSKDRQDALTELVRRAEAVNVTTDDLTGVVCQKLNISGTPNFRNFSDATMDKALKAMREHVEEAEESAAIQAEHNQQTFTKQPVPEDAKSVKTAAQGGRSR